MGSTMDMAATTNQPMVHTMPLLTSMTPPMGPTTRLATLPARTMEPRAQTTMVLTLPPNMDHPILQATRITTHLTLLTNMTRELTMLPITATAMAPTTPLTELPTDTPRMPPPHMMLMDTTLIMDTMDTDIM